MADSTGSSGAGAGAGAAAGHGTLGSRGITQQGQSYQAFSTSSSSSSMNRIAPGAANIYPQQPHHQLPHPVGALFPAATVGMSTPPPRPMYPTQTQIVVQPQQQQLAPPPPQYRVVGQQSHQPPPLAGHYQLHQDYPAYGNATASPTSASLGLDGWRVYNVAMPFAHQTPFGGGGGGINNCNISVSGNDFHQNSSSPYSTSIWANTVPMNQQQQQQQPYCTDYVPAATNEPAAAALQAHASFHIDNQQGSDLGFATSFVGATAPLVSDSPFGVMPQTMGNCTSAQIIPEVENLDFVQGTGTIWASGSVEIEERGNSEETDPDPELEAQNQLGQGVGDINDATDNTIINCKDYRTVLRKDLTNTDCGNIGRIVLPKKVAEANLPALVDKDGIILEMKDLEIPDVWKFKYRYWPNNKSRMYILEMTGDFVRTHNLRAGDVFIIYQHKRTGKYIARAVKTTQMSFTMTVLECQCMKEGNSGEQCGFVVKPPNKKT